ncbi:MAG TPA: HYR domain-containing protein [Saprospiraceae bacterium]|nr:HYR domain-containing protein [Saprospiraceae bacterium]
MKKIFLLFLVWSYSSMVFAQVNYTANDQVAPYPGVFRPGINFDYYPPYTGIDLANISAGNPALNLPGIGSRTSRPALYENFTEIWGIDFLVNDFQHFQSLGMEDLTMIVGFPAEWHRDHQVYCSDGVTQSQMFANLYTPVWDGGANGTPYNDDNYLAAYMYQLVTTYHDHVKFWEIWNEPGFDHSFVQGWQPPGGPGNWWDNDPSPCVNHFKAPIEHFVRTLRICYDVIKTVDPDAYVALAGVGFESFLDAVLRNTDNPVDGSVTPDYPLGGGAYFDVMGFHTYPDIDGSVREWDSNTNQWVYHRNSDAAAQGIPNRRNTYQNRLAMYGYDGITYPKKEWIITEINTPRVPFYNVNPNSMASDESQTNYITKAVVAAMKLDIRQMHPYQLADRETVANADEEFDLLGMYLNFNNTQPYTSLTKTNEGIAYTTTSKLIFGTRYDAAKTAAMNLPSNLDGAAFYDAPNNRYKYILWAKTTLDKSEAASGTYSFPASFGLTTINKREWNWSETHASSDISPNNIALTGRPIYLIEGQDPGNGNLTMTCPADIHVDLPQGASSVSVTWNDPMATTTCPASSTASVSQTAGMAPGSDFWTGTHPITYGAFDQCGNTASCSFNVIVGPSSSNSVITTTCPNDMTIELPANQTSMTVTWADPSATTTCANGTAITITLETTMPSGSAFEAGTHTVTYSFTDQCNTQEFCSFVITVNPSTTSTCMPISGFTKIGELNGHGYYLSDNSTNWTSAQDICEQNGGYLASISSAQENSLVQNGITDMTYIGLNDMQTEGSLIWADGSAVTYTNYTTTCSWCNSNGPDYDFATMMPWDGSWAFENQWVSRPFVMELDCGNTSTGDLTMTGCPNDMNLTLPSGSSEMTVSWPMPTATTTCSSSNNVTMTQVSGPASGSNFMAGTYTISYEATDQCANTATCTFTVTVSPSSGGGTCGDVAGFTLLGQFNGHGYYLSDNSLPWDDANTAATNAGGYLASMNSQAENDFLKSQLGTNMVFIGYNDAATEGNGQWANGDPVTIDLSYANSSDNDYAVMNFWAGTWQMVSQGVYKPFIMEMECSASSTISMTCEPDKNITLDPGTSQVTISWSTPTATTTCANSQTTVNQTSGPASGSNFMAGTYNISYEATDNCGNTTTCGFTITVNSASSGCGTITGYTLLGEYNGHGYYLSDAGATWSQANTLAGNTGGYLATMNNQAENNFLHSMLNNQMVFIGYNDADAEGTGQWANGEPVTLDLSYENSPENDYAVMNFWAGTWQMVNQWVNKPYVLEMNCNGAQPAPKIAPKATAMAPGVRLIAMYPNPADDLITARLISGSDEEITFSIFNAQGQSKLLSTNQLVKGPNEVSFEIQDLEPGMYFLKATGKYANQVIRFIKVD